VARPHPPERSRGISQGQNGQFDKEQKNKGKEKRRKEKSNRRKREHMNIPKENIHDISVDFFALLILSSILFMYLP